MNISSPRDIRHDWTADEIVAVHDRPLLELIGEANRLHRAYQPQITSRRQAFSASKRAAVRKIAPIARNRRITRSNSAKSALMPVDEVLAAAKKARNAGADRFCMGAAWRQVRDGANLTPCWIWCAAFANSAWRPASRSAC